MRKYLYITEYSNLLPHKVPVKESNEYDLKQKDSIIRSSIKDYDINSVSDNSTYSILDEKIIPLDKVFIYDDMDVELPKDSEQQIAYVFECPICLDITITTNKDYNFCEHCENTKFLPKLIALINLEQMENIAIEDKDISEFILVKDNKVVFEDRKNKQK